MTTEPADPVVGRIVDLSASPTLTPIATNDAPAAIGPYAQAVRLGELIFTSGQIGLDPRRGELVAGGVVAEARQALANVAAVLAAGGSGLDRVVKTTVFLVDLGDFVAMNEVYAAAFGDAVPARSTVAVAALPRGARCLVEAIATTVR